MLYKVPVNDVYMIIVIGMTLDQFCKDIMSHTIVVRSLCMQIQLNLLLLLS